MNSLRFDNVLRLWLMILSVSTSVTQAEPRSPTTNSPIPWDQIGAKAGADYHGDGLAVSQTQQGARLHCVFQRLEGEATSAGLWLNSTATAPISDRFQVKAVSVGRLTGFDKSPAFGVFSASPAPLQPGRTAGDKYSLADRGTIQVTEMQVRFLRPALVEEYSVSMDGVRQDFVVLDRPSLNAQLSTITSPTELLVSLAVTGATVVQTADGVQLVLAQSGRKIAYNRLRVTDATGKELPARMEVLRRDGLVPLETDLAIVVNDTDAVYPVRIDPTFSDANWISINPNVPGADSYVYAAVVNSSGDLIIGGNFTVVGGVIARYIAKWNGTNWSGLGTGMNSWVHALAVSGNDVYAGGGFTTAGGVPANRIAKWNGSSWSALGTGLGFSSAWAIAVSGNDVYVGGDFNTAGGNPANRIAKWNGSTWSPLGSGMNNQVNALAVAGNVLYAGGLFTTAGGNAAHYIARWTGSTWLPLGVGVNAEVVSLTMFGGNPIAGGAFTTATNSGGGTVNVNYIAGWDGASWFQLGSGMGGVGVGGAIPRVDALAVSDGVLYAGGWFTMAGGGPANGIAKWNGANWSALGSGLGGGLQEVSAIATSGGNIFVGGGFSAAGGVSANFCARWDGNQWWTLGSSGMNGVVRALTVMGNDLYVGGDFTTAGNSTVNYIAKWNGSTWSPLGTGMNQAVWALAAHGTNLYAGGAFTMADGNQALRIAKWDGSGWSVPGPGMSGLVYAFASAGNDLYAGGAFNNAYHLDPTFGVAKWNGTNWSALGKGLNGAVFALALSGSDLYAGGNFSFATNSNGDSVAANRIAKWNGDFWSALSSGMDDRVSALAVVGTNLYAGGYFRNAGNGAAAYIARWNGSNWSPVGSGMSSVVAALCASGSDLYAAGYFSSTAARYIAKWDGNNWAPLGSGLNSTVMALTTSGDDLYAGGWFTLAGGKVSAYVARAYLPDFPTLSVSSSGTDNVMISWPSTNTSGFLLEQTSTLSPPVNWVSNSASVTVDVSSRSVVLPATNGSQFFRLRRP